MRPAVPLAFALLLAGCTLPGSQNEGSFYFEEVIGGAPFTDLVIEIDHAPGHLPSVEARNHLVEQLRAVTSKTRVRIEVEETLPGDTTKQWTSEELVALERDTRTATHAAPVAVLHVLYPAGTHAKNPDATGITISDTVNVATVAVFLDRIAQYDAGLLPTPLPYPEDAVEQVEKVTLLHEAGHAMGLVNNGLPMVTPHEDPQNPGHSNSESSVMWAAVEQEDGLRDALLGGQELPLYFDDNDRADLRRAGGR